MNIDKKALIGIITEIEASRERAKAETRHQSEILKQAKEKQFDTKAIRKVLQRRAMSAGDRDSLDLAVDTYERAMGSLASAQEAVAEGRMTGRQAAEHYGVPRGALAVVTGGSKTGFSSHDPETGEVNDQDDGDSGREPAVRVGAAVAAMGGDARAFGMAAVGCPAASAYDATAGATGDQGASEPEGTPCAPVEVGAVGPSSGRVAPQTDAEVLAAMDAAHERMQASLRARTA